MEIEIKKPVPDVGAPDDLPVYGEHRFTANEIVRWRLVADDADAYWNEHGSDNSLDAEFKQRFGVTFFEHTHLSILSGRWRYEHGEELGPF